MLRGFYNADSGATSTAGAAQADAPVNESDAPPDAPAATPDTTGDDDPDDDDDSDSETEPELTTEQLNRELERARRQSATRRVQLREAREQLTAAQARIAELEASAPPAPPDDTAARIAAAERRAAIAEAAASANVPMAALQAFRALEAAEADAIPAALEALRGYLGSGPVGGHKPPVDVGSTPTLDQQIADAEAKGDYKTSMRLKALKTQQK